MKSQMFWLTGLLGVALILAPFVLTDHEDTNAQWSSVILGVVILAASIIAPFDQGTTNWEYWVAGVAGVVVVAAPFLFNFRAADQSTEMWTSIVLGVLTVLAAGYEALLRPQQTQIR